MKVFWRQTGLHIEPENKKEFAALMLVYSTLNRVDVNEGVPRSPVANSCNQQTVRVVNKFTQMVSKLSGRTVPTPEPFR